MTKKKGNASKVEALSILDQEDLLVFKVNRPVTDREFETLRSRMESQQKEGIKIILVPYLLDLKEE